VLLIDDDRLLRMFLRDGLRAEGYLIDEAGTGKEGLTKLAAADFSLVVTDLRMPDMSGLDVIREGKRLKPETKWIIITAYGTIANAVEAMKEGASDYLTKPLSSPDELRRSWDVYSEKWKRSKRSPSSPKNWAGNTTA